MQTPKATLHDACHTGTIEDVRRLLTLHPELVNHSRAEDGCRPLHLAAFAGRLQIVNDLLDRDAEIHAGDRTGYTPLHYAAAGGAVDVVHRLIYAGADLHATNDSHTSVLHMAAAGGIVDLVKELLQLGFAPDTPNLYGETPLHRAAQGNRLDVVRALVGQGASVDAVDRYAMVAVHKAAIGGAVEVLDQLVDFGASLTVVDLLGDTPLHAAAGMARTDAVRWLIDQSVDVDTSNAEQATPLHAAARRGATEALDLLLSRGAKPDASDALGRTPLHVAAAEGRSEMLGTLAREGATVDVEDRTRNTPCDLAATYGRPGAYQVLSDLGGTGSIEPAAVRKLIGHLPSQGEAAVWYLGHSGWAIRTANHFLVIDYAPDGPDGDEGSLLNGRIVTAELPNLPITVLVTHHHADHFSPRVLEWQIDHNVRYVFGWHAEVDAPGHRFTGAGDLSLDGLGITAVPSTDSGVAFLIEVDGLRIYHAGDHAATQIPPEAAFAEGVRQLGDRFAPIDLAFLPVFGCGLPNIVSLRAGNDLTLNCLSPRVVAPMHVGWTGHFYREEKRRIESTHRDISVVAVSQPGDRYSVREGRAVPLMP